MKKLQLLYNILGINQKIKDNHARCLYLHEVWGLNQDGIAECEEISQSVVSRRLKEARRKINLYELYHGRLFTITSEEIMHLQALPREILNDSQLIAFVTDILRIYPTHNFYSNFEYNSSLKCAALYSLGVQNKRLQTLYKRSQAAVSMSVRRTLEKAMKVERFNRYDLNVPLTLQEKGMNARPNFIKAGGTDHGN